MAYLSCAKDNEYPLLLIFNLSSSYYKVVVFIDPLQGLYAILFGDTVDWFFSPTT